MITDFRLKVFKTVCDTMNFTRASKELCITQPAVTKHINELEKQLSCQLFVRQSGKISLTPQGDILLKYTDKILDLYSNINNEFVSNMFDVEGVLSLGASTTISQYLIPPILAKFKRLYPNIKIKFLSGNTQQIEQLLVDNKIDFGIIEGNAQNRQLHYQTFVKDEIVLITSINNKLNLDEITSEQLLNLKFVIRESGSGTLDVVEKALATKKISFNDLTIEMQLGNTESIKKYIYNSDTFAFVSITAVLDELKEQKLKVIDIYDLQISRLFNFATLHGKQNNLIELFKNFCIKNIQRK